MRALRRTQAPVGATANVVSRNHVARVPNIVVVASVAPPGLSGIGWFMFPWLTPWANRFRHSVAIGNDESHDASPNNLATLFAIRSSNSDASLFKTTAPRCCSAPAGAKAISPRREPWVWKRTRRKALVGATANSGLNHFVGVPDNFWFRHLSPVPGLMVVWWIVFPRREPWVCGRSDAPKPR